ncbi:tyrosine-type recombinase/integrase [Nonomuraea candida]|uniref:tyrosine-type recombinase/integrase n=1 Tax=Nonomuraea candida TaxID=359159 RepID=UPI000A71A6C6|nr:tyrosine-type recombinase/integrase [Nonomuraea candida]
MLGTISPYETANGTRWRFQAPPRLDPVTGEKVRPGKAGFETEQEAYLEQIKYNASIGTLTVETTASLRDVLTKRLAEASYANGTQNSYYYQTTRLPEWLLDMPLMDIDKGHIETMVMQRCEQRIKETGKPYSRSYMEALVNLVSGTFVYAVTKGVPIKNPCTGISVKRLLSRFTAKATDWRASVAVQQSGPEDWKSAMIKGAVGSGPVLTRDQVMDFIEFMPYPYHAYFITTFFQAFRRGESLGMAWERTDLSPEISAALIQETIALSGGQVQVNPTPKSGESRIALLDPYVVQALEDHQKHQNDHKAEHYPEWHDDWIFTSRRYRTSQDWHPGKVIRPCSVLGQINKWAGRSGAKIDGVRTLRRSWANIAANRLGIPPYVIMKVLGHAGETVTTEHYTQATDAQVREALAAVRDYVLGG